MAKPFTLTLLPDAPPLARKPGWHKRAVAAEKRASFTRQTTAPQRGDPRADAQAVQYAEWLAARDGTVLPASPGPRVIWSACGVGMRPQSVAFGAVTVDLPHWSYVAPAAVAWTMRDWSAPQVVDLDAAARGGLLAAFADADQAAWCDAVADGYGQPGAFVIGETVEAGADAPEAVAAPSPVEPDPAPVPPVAAPIASPAPVEAVAHPPVGIADAPAPVGIPSSDPADAMSDSWEPTAESHPVIAVCLSDKARSALFDMILDGTFPARPPVTKGGSWHLTLADALACQGLPSVRFVGLPRKPYTRRHAPEAIAA